MSNLVCWFLARQTPVGQGLLIHEVSRSHTTTHYSRYDSSGRVISSSQRPLPDNTQHSSQRDIHAPVGFEPTISAGKRPQTHALDCADTYRLMPNLKTLKFSLRVSSRGPVPITRMLELPGLHEK